MRRSYISPEFKYEEVYGSFNMKEQSSFFGSKMLEIEDSFTIKNDDLLYYQLDTGEQLDFKNELLLPPIVFDQFTEKSNNHTLKLVDLQDDFQKNTNASWELTIDLSTIFKNSMFATLKKYRTFEGLQNSMTKDNSVDLSIKNYIDLNIRSRYKFNRVEMFLEYVDLLSVEGKKYNNIFDQNIGISEKKFTKFQTATEFDDSKVKIIFSQQQKASLYAFRYYFDLYFVKL